jgi:hypothetical protein
VREVNDGYAVRMNKAIQNILIAVLNICRFTLVHQNNTFAAVIRANQLADTQQLQTLINRIKSTSVGSEIIFSIHDEILIYTAVDITCKFFLTNLSEEMQRNVSDYLKAKDSDFYQIRNILLRGAEFVRENMRKTFASNQLFMQRVQLLDMILNVEG